MPVVLLPVKKLTNAKSRLALPPAQREEVARALMEHTIRTATQTVGADKVVVVTADSTVRRLASDLRTHVALDEHHELNAAIESGLRTSARSRQGAPILVLVVDLPRLTPDDLEVTLKLMGGTNLPSFVPDLHGSGTTSVFVPVGCNVAMKFGHGSARRFQADGLLPLTDVPTSMRTDLDTLQDLRTYGMPAARARDRT